MENDKLNEIINYINEKGNAISSVNDIKILFNYILEFLENDESADDILRCYNDKLNESFNKNDNLLNEVINYIINENDIPTELKFNYELPKKILNLKVDGNLLKSYEQKNEIVFKYFFDDDFYYFLEQFDDCDCMFDLNEFIKNNENIIINYIEETGNVPYSVRGNKKVLEGIIKKDRLDLFFSFSESIINEVMEQTENFNKIIKYIIDTGNVPYIVQKNKKVLEGIIKKDRLDLFFSFSKSIINEAMEQAEIFNKIIKYIIDTGNVPYIVQENKKVLEGIIKKDRLDLFFSFSKSIINEAMEQAEIFNKIIKYIIDTGNVPYIVQENKKVLEGIIKANRLDLIFGVYRLSFSESIINEAMEQAEIFNKIIKYIIDTKVVPAGFMENKKVLEGIIKKDRLDLFFSFSESIINEAMEQAEIFNKIIKYIIDTEVVPAGFMENKKVLEGIIKYIIDTEDVPYIVQKNKKVLEGIIKANRVDLISKFDNNLIDEYVQDENNFNKMLNCYINRAKTLLNCDINDDVFLKCKELFKKNFDAIFTLNFEFLGDKFKKISVEKLEYFALHTDIQKMILSFDEKSVDILIVIINYLDVTYCDVFPIINNILDNYSNYSNLLNSIDINNLNEEELCNLLIVMQNKDNYLGINDINELNNFNYKTRKTNYYKTIEDKINNNNISIVELRKVIFLKKFNMSIEQVEFLINRYCQNVDLLDNSGLPKKDIKILKTISYLYNCNDIEELKFYFIGDFMMENFYSVVNLDSKIRKDYAKLYNDTLYKVNDKDIINENCELYSSNREVYDKLINTKYNGANPKFYLLRDDFNLQIHVLGAYSQFEVPSNFKDSWNRPNISSHGICTSYIGHNQIASARDTKSHPIYGFDGYENSGLLLLGNVDLASSDANKKFVTSYGYTYGRVCFFSPKDMIDFTRHTHNEIVIERRNLDNTKFNFKRMPSYVVYFVDDINNVNNFDDNNSYYKETVQAAIDHDIPILLVDRLYYAKREIDKCNKLMGDIFNNKEYNKMSDLIVNYMNNVVGCIKYSDQKEYHNYFNENGFDCMYNTIIDNINNEFNINDKKILLLNLYKSILNEVDKIEILGAVSNLSGYYAKFNFDNKISQLKNLIEELGVVLEFEHVIKGDIDNEINNIISTTYYDNDTSDEIKSLIEMDINNGVSKEDIAEKINNGFYERNDRINIR